MLNITTMRKFTLFTLLWISILIPLSGLAAPQEEGGREKWMTELRQYKRVYFNKELDLSHEQQTKFYPLYEEMEDKVFKINDDARAMEKRVDEMTNPSDLEYEKATEAMYDAKVREAEIEKEYMEKFSAILSPRQLFRLKAVERQFSRELMKQHHRLRAKFRGDKDK